MDVKLCHNGHCHFVCLHFCYTNAYVTKLFIVEFQLVCKSLLWSNANFTDLDFLLTLILKSQSFLVKSESTFLIIKLQILRCRITTLCHKITKFTKLHFVNLKLNVFCLKYQKKDLNLLTWKYIFVVRFFWLQLFSEIIKFYCKKQMWQNHSF